MVQFLWTVVFKIGNQHSHEKISARQFHKLRYGMSVGYTRAVHLPLSFYNYMNHLKSCECDIMLNHKDESEREYRRPLDWSLPGITVWSCWHVEAVCSQGIMRIITADHTKKKEIKIKLKHSFLEADLSF